MLYQMTRELIRLAAHVFFRRIELVGLEHIPMSNAAIFYGNHPNSLLDPGLITAFGERKLHFAAKDTLFSQPLTCGLFRRLGAVPIKRRKDHPDGPLDNQEAFSALYKILEEGKAMGIFPEGISHNGVQLAELKTGAARIALEMHRRGVKVLLVPCGLNYLKRGRFRSTVLIQFGEPISVHKWLNAHAPTTPHPDARALTDHMELHLRALTINAESWEDLALLDTVRRLYQPPRITIEERAELARRFNAHYPALRNMPDIISLSNSVSAYRQDLYSLGLRDRDLNASLNTSALVFRLLRHLTLVLVWLPLALLGAPLHMPLALFLNWSSRLIAPRKNVIATTHFLVGVFTLLATYLGLGVLTWSLGAGWYASLVPILIALSGWGTLKVAERGHSLWRTLWVWTRCLRARATIRDLRSRRRTLHAEVLTVVNAHLPKGMERLFYQEQSIIDTPSGDE